MQPLDILRLVLIVVAAAGLLLMVFNSKRRNRKQKATAEMIFHVFFILVMVVATVLYYQDRGLSMMSIITGLAVFMGCYWFVKAFRKRKSSVSLAALREKMIERKFDKALMNEILTVLQHRIVQDGMEAFQDWIEHLDYRLPEEFEAEGTALRLYEQSSGWLEEEVHKLEQRTKLPWQEQTEDLSERDEQVRKTQLVLRQYLTEMVFEIIDSDFGQRKGKFS